MEEGPRGPFRSLVSLEAGTGTARLASVEALPAGWRVAEAAGMFQRLQGLTETFVLHRQRVAKFCAGEHGTFGKQRKHLFREAQTRFVAESRHDLQVGRLEVGRDQFQSDRRRSRRRAVLARQEQAILAASQVEVRVT